MMETLGIANMQDDLVRLPAQQKDELQILLKDAMDKSPMQTAEVLGNLKDKHRERNKRARLRTAHEQQVPDDATLPSEDEDAEMDDDKQQAK